MWIDHDPPDDQRNHDNRFIQAKGDCDKCGSDNTTVIAKSPFCPDGDPAWIKKKCRTCGYTWIEA